MKNGVWSFICSSKNSCPVVGLPLCSEGQEAPKAIRRTGSGAGPRRITVPLPEIVATMDVGVGDREKSSRTDVCLVEIES